MIESAFIVEGDRQIRLCQGLCHFGSRFAATCGGIAHGVQSLGKAPEIVNGFQTTGRADDRDVGIPMRADDQDGSWPGQLVSHAFQGCSGGARVEGKGRRAVRHK